MHLGECFGDDGCVLTMQRERSLTDEVLELTHVKALATPGLEEHGLDNFELGPLEDDGLAVRSRIVWDEAEAAQA